MILQTPFRSAFLLNYYSFFSRFSRGTFRRNYTIYGRSATSAGGIEYIVDGGGIRSHSRQVYTLQQLSGYVCRVLLRFLSFFSSFNQRTSLSKLKQKIWYNNMILSAYIYIAVFRVAQSNRKSRAKIKCIMYIHI